MAAALKVGFLMTQRQAESTHFPVQANLSEKFTKTTNDKPLTA